MSEQFKKNAQADETPVANGSGNSKARKELFPPELSRWQICGLIIAYFFFVGGLLFFFFAGLLCAVDKFCFENHFMFPSGLNGTYISLGLIPLGIILDRYIRHRILVHKARREDPSSVYATMVEADTVEPRLTNPERPDDYRKNKDDLKNEVERLKKLGQDGWTEYQVLPLNQMLVAFLKLDDLKSRTEMNLDILKEWSEETGHPLDKESYRTWEDRIEVAKEQIDKNKDISPQDDDAKLDDNAKSLRAELKTLLEQVAEYQANWKEGSTVRNSLMICGAASIPILLVMGLLPVFHPMGDKILSFFNWGLLGVSGSLTAVLLGIRKSDLVEVGNTEGKKELWRALLGAILGFVAGFIVYATIVGGLLASGAAVPEIAEPGLKNVFLSFLWAFGAGFSFERVFDKMRTSFDEKV